MAVDVCELAGKPFYYSTKSALQQVELHHGVRLTGAMTAEDIHRFCLTHDIHCIVNAAHPFAEGLHRAIAESGMQVIRLERRYAERQPGVTYLQHWDEAVSVIQSRRLLALSGVNTIARLKDYWTRHETYFRILQREESMEVVRRDGFPTERLLFYPSAMPSVEEEKAMMLRSGCDAILTKESGESGGFGNKVQAALELGLKVYVVQHPVLPAQWMTCEGRHTLRRLIQQVVPEFFPLRTGLTTGACATAAVKAAALSLLRGDEPEAVAFALPDGEVLSVPVMCQEPGVATVVKEDNDDPDVTKGCCITARVSLRRDDRIVFLPGEGVGRVTLPGLGIPVGEPAINPTPRRMIAREIRSLTDCGMDVTLSVADGARLWHQTFNNKVGVVDGISIIGTSGIVSPLSNEAFVESIGRELQVAKALGCTAIGLASGKKGEDALNAAEPALRVIHYGNFVGETLRRAHALGFRRVVLGIMIGKAVKLAEGHLDTHSHKVAADLGKWGVKMARELWDVMPPTFFDGICADCLRHCRTVFPDGELEVRLIKDETR